MFCGNFFDEFFYLVGYYSIVVLLSWLKSWFFMILSCCLVMIVREFIVRVLLNVKCFCSMLFRLWL